MEKAEKWASAVLSVFLAFTMLFSSAGTVLAEDAEQEQPDNPPQQQKVFTIKVKDKNNNPVKGMTAEIDLSSLSRAGLPESEYEFKSNTDEEGKVEVPQITNTLNAYWKDERAEYTSFEIKYSIYDKDGEYSYRQGKSLEIKKGEQDQTCSVVVEKGSLDLKVKDGEKNIENEKVKIDLSSLEEVDKDFKDKKVEAETDRDGKISLSIIYKTLNKYYRTHDDNSFEFSYVLYDSSHKYKHKKGKFTLRKDTLTDDVVVNVEKGGFVFKVKDEDGKPVAGIDVEFELDAFAEIKDKYGTADGMAVKGKTDSEGSLNVPDIYETLDEYYANGGEKTFTIRFSLSDSKKRHKTVERKEIRIGQEEKDGTVSYAGAYTAEMKNQYYITFKTRMKGYDKNDGSATAKGDVLVKISTNDGKIIVKKTDAKGEYDGFDDGLVYDETKTYTIEIVETDEYMARKYENVKFVKNTPVLVTEERDVVSKNDYTYGSKISDNGFVAKPGGYTIKGTSGRQVGKSLTGSFGSETTIRMNSDGSCETLYVKENGKVKKPAQNVLELDETSPVVERVNVSKDGTSPYVNFFDFGMFSEKSSTINIKATLTDVGSGVKGAKLVGRNTDGSIKVYEPVSESKSGSGFVLDFRISKTSGVLEQALTIKAVDKVDNESNLALVRRIVSGDEGQNTLASTFMIEDIAPKIADVKTAGTSSPHKWYRSAVDFTTNAIDENSGLNSVKIEMNGKTVYNKGYSEGARTKTASTKAYNHNLSKEEIKSLDRNTGRYTFKIKAMDNAGNTQVKVKTIKADIVKPVVSFSGIDAKKHYRKTPTLHIDNNEKFYSSSGAYIHVDIVRDGEKVSSRDYKRKQGLNISSFGADGDYKVSAYARDAAGNTSAVKTVSFVKDSTAPRIYIAGAKENSFNNVSKIVTVTVKERYYKTDNVKIQVTRKLNGRADRMSFPWRNRGELSKSSKTFSDTGTYTVVVTAKDKAGNIAERKTRTFTIDRVVPKITVNGVTDGKAYGFRESPAPRIAISDDYFSGKTISLDSTRNNSKNITFNDDFGSKGGKRVYAAFKKEKKNDDIYTLRINASDKAGNKSSKTIKFAVNRFGSNFRYGESTKNINKSYLKKVKEPLTIIEQNVSKPKSVKAKVSLDGQEAQNVNVSRRKKGGDVSWYECVYTFEPEDFSREGVYNINITTRDKAGNLSESAKSAGKLSFAVDKTGPSISAAGVHSGKIYKANSKEFTVYATDSIAFDKMFVELDGKEIRSGAGNNYSIPAGMNHKIKITAYDKAGNKSVRNIDNVTVSTNIFIMYFANKPLFFGSLAVVAAAVAAWFFLRKKYRGRHEAKSKEEGVRQ